MTASAAHSILPSLSADEERHSRAAEALIRERLLAAGGWLSFEQFMELALYAPGVGYYSAGSVKIGAGGDFVTAPEVSDLFSRCVARQCADVLVETGGEILELGAGTGRMAATVLLSLASLGVLPERYAILEVSADLADRQRTRIQQLPAELRERVVWLDRLPETAIRGVVLANEVVDALPFRRFVVHGGSVREMGVGVEGESFVWRERPGSSVGDGTPADGTQHGAPDALVAAANALIGELPFALPDGYTSEICLRAEPWVTSVSQCLEQGMLLLFDYGLPRAHYYHPQRTDGTLRCYFKQRAHDNPFTNIAVQDITAWVDFTRVGEAALNAKLEVAGFATQAAFLLGTGIEALTAEPPDLADRARLAGEARRLLLPGEMGESFKVMALCRNLVQPLRGFAYQDLRTSL
ncbi:MAG: class I SAM-dependent methyltransferase [Steroidobacteraceae bacterium]